MKEKLNAIAKMHEDAERRRQAALLKRKRAEMLRGEVESAEGAVKEVAKKSEEKDSD